MELAGMMRRQQGFTLLEILVAIAVLAVGVLAAVGLQSSSLQASRNAQLRERAVVLARNEMDYQRAASAASARTMPSNPISSATPVDCTSISSGPYICKVTITPCDWVKSTTTVPPTLACGATTDAVADQITVNVTWNSRSITLKSISARPGKL